MSNRCRSVIRSDAYCPIAVVGGSDCDANSRIAVAILSWHDRIVLPQSHPSLPGDLYMIAPFRPTINQSSAHLAAPRNPLPTSKRCRLPAQTAARATPRLGHPRPARVQVPRLARLPALGRLPRTLISASQARPQAAASRALRRRLPDQTARAQDLHDRLAHLPVRASCPGLLAWL